MYIMPWDKSIETGIELVDKQHKEFIMHANKFVIKIRAQKQMEAAHEEVEFLQNYLLYHFQTEEAFQVQSDYPGYLEHQASHKNLKFQVQEIATNLKVHDYSQEAVMQFYEMIHKWIVGHILAEDKAFAEHYIQYLKNR